MAFRLPNAARNLQTFLSAKSRTCSRTIASHSSIRTLPNVMQSNYLTFSAISVTAFRFSTCLFYFPICLILIGHCIIIVFNLCRFWQILLVLQPLWTVPLRFCPNHGGTCSVRKCRKDLRSTSNLVEPRRRILGKQNHYRNPHQGILNLIRSLHLSMNLKLDPPVGSNYIFF